MFSSLLNPVRSVTKTTSGRTNKFVSGEGFLIPKGWMGTFEISKDVESNLFL